MGCHGADEQLPVLDESDGKRQAADDDEQNETLVSSLFEKISLWRR
jgi:hypothetical protein